MRLSRRSFFVMLLSLLAPAALGHPGAHRHPHVRRWGGRWLRGRRWRIRRRPAWRVIRGRRLLVVPLAVASGWELEIDDQVLLVDDVYDDYIVVHGPDGGSRKIPVVKEDTKQNLEEFEGSEVLEEAK
ncbi:MAG: hypothetical protein LJE84_03660 [Gammaproteobacteria bacterium]|nr:hypothetical protein [Gammaproteobacteria bacterium]